MQFCNLPNTPNLQSVPTVKLIRKPYKAYNKFHMYFIKPKIRELNVEINTDNQILSILPHSLLSKINLNNKLNIIENTIITA